MPEIKIGVSAGAQNVEAAIKRVTAAMNAMGAAVAKSQGGLKFEDTTTKLMARDISLLNKQFAEAIKLSATLRNALKATGQSNAHISQVDFSKLSADPRIAQRMRDRAYNFATRGTSLDLSGFNDVDGGGNAVPPAPPGGGSGGGNGGSGGGGARRVPGGGRRGGGSGGGAGGGGTTGGSWWTRRPQNMGTAAALAIGNGVGGAAGNILTAGISGGPMGALLAGVTSAIGGAVNFASEGVDMAKGRNLDLDDLKRQLGDLGVSFKTLSDDSWAFGKNLGLANTEFVKLEKLAQSSSGGLYRDANAVGSATQTGVGLSRAYGWDPSQGVDFVGKMDRLDSHRNNQELAAQLADAITRSAGHATSDEVAQALIGFTAMQNRFNSQSPNADRVGSALGSMVSNPGMTADHASGILGTANASFQNMGNSEAAQNFFIRQFGLDPIESRWRAQGGLFDNGLASPNLDKYMGTAWTAAHANGGPQGSNLDVIKAGLDRSYGGMGGGRKLELDAFQNITGLKSGDDAAALYNMRSSDQNAIGSLLKRNGLSLDSLKGNNIQTMSDIANATDKNIKDVAGKVLGRDDTTNTDKDLINKALDSGDFKKIQDTLARVEGGKGQEDTAATTQRDISANIADMKTQIGERLIPFTNTIMGAVVALAEKFTSYGATNPDMTTGAGAPYGFGGSMPTPAQFDGGIPTGTGSRGIGNSIGAGTASSNALMKQLIDSGMSPEQAAGVAGNVQQESSFNPSNTNGDHYGLYQFSTDLQSKYKSWSGGKDIHGSSAEDQTKFMLSLIKDDPAMAGFRAAKTVDGAAAQFDMHFEKPGNYGQENVKRARYAEQANADYHAKIPDADAAKAAAAAASARADAAGGSVTRHGALAQHQGGGNTTVNLVLNQTNSQGKKSVHKTSTTLPKPAGGGADINPQIIELPAH
jgi:Phage tail lysozyme